MIINLTGKTALVTGSLSGIGKGIATALVKAGTNMIIHGFGSEEEINTRLRELRTSSNKVEFIYADLNKPDDISYMVRHSMRLFGGIDILVNNAGKHHNDRMEDIPNKVWEETINVNLNSSFYTTKGVLSYMQQKGWGRIINIAGVQGLVGFPSKGALVASKHALVGLTKSTALENARSGITCNAICPGFVLTAQKQKDMDEAEEEGMSREEAMSKVVGGDMPSKKHSSVEDIG